MIKFLENYISYIIGLIGTLLLYKFTNIQYSINQEFIKQFTTIGTCTFGFLLTLFGLIIQGDNQVINKMRKRHNTFIRFTCVNRKVVFISLALTIYAYFIGYIDLSKIINETNEYKTIILKCLTCIFYGGFVCFILETMYFLLIFYLIIQGKKENSNDTM